MKWDDRCGWIMMIVGTMFSGKTTELLEQMEDIQENGYEDEIVLFTRDSRSGDGRVFTHGGSVEQKAVYVKSYKEIESLLMGRYKHCKHVFIDEIQFFEPEIVDMCQRLAEEKKMSFTCAGLTQDYLAKPFETTMAMMANAHFIDVMKCCCSGCEEEYCYNYAVRNYRKSHTGDRILEGGSESYEALCTACYNKRMKT